ncbi:MAG: extradiol dioxygenase family protein [Flammeovirgaceae bacterium]|jgi:extradiol dioxygenase family protein
MSTPFHLSLPCRSVSTTKSFYIDQLGAYAGREASTWVDIDLYGNQITFIKDESFHFDYHNYRFGDSIIPAFHFGILLGKGVWEELFDKLSEAKITLTEKRPYLKDEPGEHQSYFLEDPNGYTVEFKCFSKEGDTFNK